MSMDLTKNHAMSIFCSLMSTASKKIAILGAGISGLSLAYFLEREQPDAEIVIYEKSDRVGGWIRSDRIDGHLLERGPRSIRTGGLGQKTLALVKELGLESEMVLPSKAAGRRFLWNEGKLQKVPSGRLLRGIWRDILREWRVPPGRAEDETIHAFFSRRFGERFTERLVDPMIAGIFAGNPRTLSIRSCLPRVFEMEQASGSLVRGFLRRKRHPFEMYSFQNGMETLPRTLAEKIRSPIHFNTPIESGDQIDADLIYSTLPAHAVGKVFPELHAKLEKIPFASLAVVGLVYDRPVLKQRGFGYLIPSKENQQILGCVFDSCVFPQQNSGNETRLSVMMHGVEKPDDTLIDLAKKNIARHLGITETPVVASVKRAEQAIPQYPLGHHRLVAELDEHPRLKLLGISFRGVSLNDCIHAARIAAQS